MLLNRVLEELLFSPQLNVYHHHQGMLFSIKDRTLFLLSWHILDSLFRILYIKTKISYHLGESYHKYSENEQRSISDLRMQEF